MFLVERLNSLDQLDPKWQQFAQGVIGEFVNLQP